MRKQLLSIVALLVLVAALGFAAGQPEQESGAGGVEPSLITIGAAPLGGAYYPTAVGMADLITKYVPETEGRVEVTGGTVENPVLMQQGDIELGLANAHLAYFGYIGDEPFNQELDRLRGLFVGLAPGAVQYVVRANSGIESFEDLAGKRVAIGPQGNSSGLVFQLLLDFYGMSMDDVVPSYISFADGVRAVLDGQADMAVVQAGIPSPGITEAYASPVEIQLLSFPESDVDAFLEEHPYFRRLDITPDYYDGLDETVNTFATNNMVMVRDDLSEELVYEITAALFDHLDEFRQAHPVVRWVNLEEAPFSPIPLHPGAERYFREQGVLE